MIEFIVFFLAVSFVLYSIFGGADFGAGILELFCPANNRDRFRILITKAIGPVWEANHIWIILVIVIIFTVFPEAYSTISTTFHIPLVIMLFGIVFRGCAFTFRHYDAKVDVTNEIYSVIFAASSLLTPFSQGLIIGGLIMGVPPENPSTFQEAYILPWLNLFSIMTGIFFTLLCALIAAVFLLCESTSTEFTGMLKRRVNQLSFLSIVTGIFVFVAAESKDFSLFGLFFSNPGSIVSFTVATICLVLINACISKPRNEQLLRVLICVIITLILSGWWQMQFPYLMGIPQKGNHAFNIYEAASPDAVLKQVIIALIIGSILIFPALFFLLRTFKFRK